MVTASSLGSMRTGSRPRPRRFKLKPIGQKIYRGRRRYGKKT